MSVCSTVLGASSGCVCVRSEVNASACALVGQLCVDKLGGGGLLQMQQIFGGLDYMHGLCFIA